MKPFEILSSLPQWSRLSSEEIVDSPAFAMPCRLGEESVTLTLGAMPPADAIVLSIMLDDEPHVLSIGRSSRFSGLDAVWDSRADVPEPILLALVEKDAGPVLQLIENAVHRRLKVVGLAASVSPDARTMFAHVADVVFALTRTPTVVSAIGNLRNLDLSHESIRSVLLPSVVEHVVFALPSEDMSGLEVGDAVLLPELGTVPARLVVDGRFSLDEGGVSRYDPLELVRVVDAEPKDISLGELFDASESPRAVEAKTSGSLRLVRKGATLAVGHLDKLAEQPALVVEAL